MLQIGQIHRYNHGLKFKKSKKININSQYKKFKSKRVMGDFKKVFIENEDRIKFNFFDFYVNFLNFSCMHYNYLRHKIYHHYYNFIESKLINFKH